MWGLKQLATQGQLLANKGPYELNVLLYMLQINDLRF